MSKEAFPWQLHTGPITSQTARDQFLPEINSLVAMDQFHGLRSLCPRKHFLGSCIPIFNTQGSVPCQRSVLWPTQSVSRDQFLGHLHIAWAIILPILAVSQKKNIMHMSDMFSKQG